MKFLLQHLPPRCNKPTPHRHVASNWSPGHIGTRTWGVPGLSAIRNQEPRKEKLPKLTRNQSGKATLTGLTGWNNRGLDACLRASFCQLFPRSDASEEGLSKYLHMIPHMRTRHIGAKAAPERRRSRRRRARGEERERERGSARKEENRGGRETERATGEKKLGQVRQVTAAARDSSATAACSLIRQEKKKRDLFLLDRFLIKMKARAGVLTRLFL